MNKLSALIIVLSVVTLASCNNDNDTPAAAANNTTTVPATIDNKATVPATLSMATGTLTGYNKTTIVFNYTVTYQGTPPDMGHFHYGTPGEKGKRSRWL